MKHRIARAVVVGFALLVASALAVPIGAAPPVASSPPERQAQPPRSSQALTVDDLSVVKVRAQAVAGARSSATLGAHREGTGVVVEPGGLVVTIGYLILEAETVELSTADGRTFPATVVGRDDASGLGLLRPVGTLPIKPIQIGDPGALGVGERIAIVGFDGVAAGVMVSRRPYVGYWEYLLEDAIYTAPATVNWQGAALINREGKLLGIGSLLVPDAVDGERKVAGHVFVPIDRLAGMLADLGAHGRSPRSPRPWLGVHTEEAQGNVVVTRTLPAGPAEAASLRTGDVIVALGPHLVKGRAQFYSRLWASGAAGVEIPLTILRDGRLESVTVKSIDRETYYRARPVY